MTGAELDHIAVELTQHKEGRETGSYLWYLGVLWNKADAGNREVLRAALENAIKKYHLGGLLNHRYGVDEGRRMVEECNEDKDFSAMCQAAGLHTFQRLDEEEAQG